MEVERRSICQAVENSSVAVVMVVFGVGSRRGFFFAVSPETLPYLVNTYRLSSLRISAWLYEAPMTLRSGVAGCLLLSRWLFAEEVRQNGDPVLWKL